MHNYYPICLEITNRSCVVIGGGRVAERKTVGLLAHGGRVTLISPKITAGLAALRDSGQLRWLDRPYRQDDLKNAFLAIAATDDPAVQEAVHQEAERLGILLNIADVPSLCNFILPSTLRRGDLTISISTGGKSPALAKGMREKLEKEYGPEYEVYLAILGEIRAAILARGNSSADNKILFESLLHPDFPQWIREGCWEKIRNHLHQATGISLNLVPFARALGQSKALDGGNHHE